MRSAAKREVASRMASAFSPRPKSSGGGLFGIMAGALARSVGGGERGSDRVGVWADSRLRRQFRCAGADSRMPPLRRDLGEGAHHEQSLVGSGMREHSPSPSRGEG